MGIFFKINENPDESPPLVPLPEPDPAEGPSKWDTKTMYMGFPVDKGDKVWAKPGDVPKSSSDPDWRGVIRDNIIPIKVEPYTHGQPHHSNYYYFDTPDYADPFKKLWYSFKWFAKSGFVIGCIWGMSTGRPCNLKNLTFLFSNVTFPWMAAGTAASTTAITVANLRNKKDDYWNYVAAGLTAGCILGRKSYPDWFKATILSTAGAVAMKYFVETNGKIYPAINLYRFSTNLAGVTGTGSMSEGDYTFGFSLFRENDPGREIRKNA